MEDALRILLWILAFWLACGIFAGGFWIVWRQGPAGFMPAFNTVFTRPLWSAVRLVAWMILSPAASLFGFRLVERPRRWNGRDRRRSH